MTEAQTTTLINYERATRGKARRTIQRQPGSDLYSGAIELLDFPSISQPVKRQAVEVE